MVAHYDESFNVKSALWMDEIVLYTTKAQLKFMLFNSDTGILKSTENILYLVQ